MSEKKTMGGRIAAARISRGLSQRQLASLAGVEPNTVSMYENDIRKPSLSVLVKMARTLHVSTDFLLLDEEDRSVYIDVSGVAEREIKVLTELADIFREKQRHSEPV